MSNAWACPNDPPCDHTGLLHDIEELGDPLPSCCVEGCLCGHDRKKRAEMWRVLTDALADPNCRSEELSPP